MGAQFSAAFVVEKLKTSNAFRGGVVGAALLLAFILKRLHTRLLLAGFRNRENGPFLVEGSGTTWVDGEYKLVTVGPGISNGKKNGCSVYKQMTFTNPPDDKDAMCSAFIYILRGGQEWRIVDDPSMLEKASGDKRNSYKELYFASATPRYCPSPPETGWYSLKDGTMNDNGHGPRVKYIGK